MFGGWFPRGGRNTNRNKLNIRFFRYNTLRIATNDFSTVIGEGGFGSVFKGVLPGDDGRIVAIKKCREPRQGPRQGFLEMVELMSNIRHVNLIQVIGCCVDNGQQLLVSEFAENGSVDIHLHGVKPSLDNWERRAAVCIGTARGLSYLHEEINPRIIHRDVKPSNIVLDANFVPKIVDFDIIHVVDAKGQETNETAVMGTYGYIDPYYMATGELTDKADVYGFGLVMLEIITGRRPSDLAVQERHQQGILNWVARVLKGGTVLNIVDPKMTDFPSEDVERFIHVALLCTQEIPKQRPSMFEVVHMLYGRHKSNKEISEMATRLVATVADQPDQWSITAYGVRTPDSVCSLTISLDGRGGSTPILGTDYAEEMESREEPFDETGRGNSDSFIVLNRTGVSHSQGIVCSASEAAVAFVETGLASSSQEDQICPEDLMRQYFERSMDKIMRYQVAKRSNRTTIMTQTIVTNKSSGNRFSEAVYPPFLTGEYRSSRVLYARRPPPL